jgi:sec-independent protein translocase protein TatA
MFGTLGGPEIFLILVIALIVFGPRKLPEIGKSMGRMLAEFRKASNDFKRTIEEEVEADKLRTLASPHVGAEPPVAAAPAPPDRESVSPPAVEADPRAVSQAPPPIEPK